MHPRSDANGPVPACATHQNNGHELLRLTWRIRLHRERRLRDRCSQESLAGGLVTGRQEVESVLVEFCGRAPQIAAHEDHIRRDMATTWNFTGLDVETSP